VFQQMAVFSQSISAWLNELASSADPVSAVRARLHQLLSFERDANPVWISRVDAAGLDAQIDALRERLTAASGELTALPLFGVPFAVKDNIDVGGFATTAACPAFAYQPGADATVVARLDNPDSTDDDRVVDIEDEETVLATPLTLAIDTDDSEAVEPAAPAP
jgi:Asp-tRNA(Asn)/Glu-tRNA(Gln) amidotransferase A subunit family amidase